MKAEVMHIYRCIGLFLSRYLRAIRFPPQSFTLSYCINKGGKTVKAIPTDVLSKELMEREGVISITVKEFEKIEVAGVVVAGPAVILINQD